MQRNDLGSEPGVLKALCCCSRRGRAANLKRFRAFFWAVNPVLVITIWLLVSMDLQDVYPEVSSAASLMSRRTSGGGYEKFLVAAGDGPDRAGSNQHVGHRTGLDSLVMDSEQHSDCALRLSYWSMS